MEIHALSVNVIYPLQRFGFTSPFLGCNIDTVISSWIAMFLLTCIAVFLRYQISKDQNSLISFSVLSSVKALSEFIGESLPNCTNDLIIFSSTVFAFILSSSLIPCIMLKEATLDLNTDLALAIVIFTYVQVWGLRFKGLGYFEKYIEPIFLFLPLNLITQSSRILSICFRLFANVLSGALIWEICQAFFNFIAPVFLICATCLFIGLAAKKAVRHFQLRVVGQDLWLEFFQIIKGVVLVPGVFFLLFIIIHGGILQSLILMMLITNYLSIEVGQHE